MQYEVGRFGAFLATRDTGAKVREELERQIRTIADGETVEVSFDDVEAVTVSFADELVGRLFSSHAAGDLPEVALVLSGLNQEVREAVAVCLERRGAVAARRFRRGLELLAADAFLLETFERARARKEFRASDIASDLGISPQNANNRLRRLVAAGALLRHRVAPEGGGKEFVYRLPR